MYLNVHYSVITLAAKHRQKGMLIILCVCVCVFAKVWENYEHWWLQQATSRLQIIQRLKITRLEYTFFYAPCPLINQAPQNDATFSTAYTAHTRTSDTNKPICIIIYYIHVYIVQTHQKAIIRMGYKNIQLHNIKKIQMHQNVTNLSCDTFSIAWRALLKTLKLKICLGSMFHIPLVGHVPTHMDTCRSFTLLYFSKCLFCAPLATFLNAALSVTSIVC